MDDFRVDYVILDSGNIPFDKFLNSISKNERAEILAMIEELRTKLSRTDKISNKISKYIKEGIFELRIRHLNKISRTLYFFQTGRLLIITHGYIKKTEKTPFDEIEKAIKYKNIYLRKNNESKNQT